MVSSNSIPLIDFAAYLNGTTQDREDVAMAIDEGLSSVGFIYVSNHGIDQNRVDECFNWSKRLFMLSEWERMKMEPSLRHSHHRGYSRVGNEKVREHSCMKDGFDIGNPEDDSQPNIWPPEELLPGFREFMEGFFQDCTKLVHQLLDCLSLALRLPAMTTLSRYHSQSLFNFSLLHYPALPLDFLRSGTHVRIPAHSDFGTITLLFQDDTGGLEIADPHSAKTETSLGFEKQGKFRPATPIPGTVVVNVGYLLMRWSNGRWKNTVHRVSHPPLKAECVDEPHDIQAKLSSAGGMAPARYSIPFFSSPDPSTIIEALPGCWSEDMPKRWKPINVGEYLDRKRQGVYT